VTRLARACLFWGGVYVGGLIASIHGGQALAHLIVRLDQRHP